MPGPPRPGRSVSQIEFRAAAELRYALCETLVVSSLVLNNYVALWRHKQECNSDESASLARDVTHQSDRVRRAPAANNGPRVRVEMSVSCAETREVYTRRAAQILRITTRVQCRQSLVVKA